MNNFSDTQPPQPDVLQEPSEGGRYVRNADGTLTCVHQTKQELGRRKQPDDQAAAPTTAATAQE